MPMYLANFSKSRVLLIFMLGMSYFKGSQANQVIDDFIDGISISGKIRSYDFYRDYSNPTAINQSAFSLGGELDAITAPFLSGFQLGGTFYTAQPLGLNSDNPKQVDATLPGDVVDVLGQAYLQYSGKKYFIRAGDQLIDTPWLGPSDSRMIPATYRGIYASYNPWQDLKLTALDITLYKSRTSNEFNHSNLYSPNNPGDNAIEAPGTNNDGALAFGANYKQNSLQSQLWLYHFYDLSNLLYADGTYTFFKSQPVRLLMGGQMLRGWDTGNNTLSTFDNGGVSDSIAFGGLIGVETDQLRFTLAYDNILEEHSAFRDGDIISPYTAGYATDPLYTTSMIAGLVEKTSGQAVKASGTYITCNKKLSFTTSYAKYFTQPNLPNTNEVDFDTTYALDQVAQGLTMRGRVGILNGNPPTGQFVYTRLMLQYIF